MWGLWRHILPCSIWSCPLLFLGVIWWDWVGGGEGQVDVGLELKTVHPVLVVETEIAENVSGAVVVVVDVRHWLKMAMASIRRGMRSNSLSCAVVGNWSCGGCAGRGGAGGGNGLAMYPGVETVVIRTPSPPILKYDCCLCRRHCSASCSNTYDIM